MTGGARPGGAGRRRLALVVGCSSRAGPRPRSPRPEPATPPPLHPNPRGSPRSSGSRRRLGHRAHRETRADPLEHRPGAWRANRGADPGERPHPASKLRTGQRLSIPLSEVQEGSEEPPSLADIVLERPRPPRP